MATYDDKTQSAVDAYLQGGGNQADVDAYFASNPSQAQVAADAGTYFDTSGGGDTFGGMNASPTGGRGSLGGALSSVGDENYAQVFNDPNRRRPEQTAAEFAAMGYSPYGMEEKWSPAPDVRAEALTRQKEGQWRAIVNKEGAVTPERKAQFEADWAKIHPTGPAAGSGGGTGPTGQAFTWSGAPTGGYLGPLSGYTGGGGGDAGAYTSPDGASSGLRALQQQAVTGLQGLLGRDTSAERAAMEKALYKGQKQGINTAADRARAAMLEGTFGRGVGSSSILVELAGRGEQEHADALARARREAYTQAGSEQRADLASQLGMLQNAGALATTGIQGEANIRLADLARMQQESQFGRNLGFQGSENAANRALSESQFGQNLGFQQAQLGQQASQFGQNLAFQGSQNEANRAAQTALAQMGYDFTGGQNDANRQVQLYLQQSGQDFAGGQNEANRAAQAGLAQMGYNFTGGENALNRTQQQNLATQGYDFTGNQAQLQRDLQTYLAQSGQEFTGGQNQLTRDQSMQQLLLNLANSRDIASGNRTAAGIGAAGAGAGAIFGPALAALIEQWGKS